MALNIDEIAENWFGDIIFIVHAFKIKKPLDRLIMGSKSLKRFFEQRFKKISQGIV